MLRSVRDLVSFFYVGRNDSFLTFIMPKIGETAQVLTDRVDDIRRKGHPYFEVLGCLILFGVTSAERKLIESEVRVSMEKYAMNVKNDHFLLCARDLKSIDATYNAFALTALAYAVDSCKKHGYSYIVKTF